MKGLTRIELKHIEISQAWLDLFLQLANKHSDISEWRLGGWTSNIIKTFLSIITSVEDIDFDEKYISYTTQKTITEDERLKKIKTLKKLISWEGVAGVGAINESKKKVISITNADEDWGNNYAYTEVWDAEYMGGIRLCFISKYNKASFKEFEDLFISFIDAKTDLEIDKFKNYVKNRYK